MPVFRSVLLLAALIGLSWFSFFNIAPARVLAAEALDPFGDRPTRSILFVGNSRMFVNEMPYMIREMADSAGSPHAYQVRMWALPGETLEQHWTRGDVRRLIGERRWDEIVFQAESAAHFERPADDFISYGRKLIEEARAHGAKPTLIVGWTYGQDAVPRSAATHLSAYHGFIQSDHRRLAGATGATLINVGQAWRRASQGGLPFRLETDGNHPSIHGSYLTALIVYAHLSGGDPERVSYVPAGLPAEDAREIRRFAAKFAGDARSF